MLSRLEDIARVTTAIAAHKRMNKESAIRLKVMACVRDGPISGHPLMGLRKD